MTKLLNSLSFCFLLSKMEAKIFISQLFLRINVMIKLVIMTNITDLLPDADFWQWASSFTYIFKCLQ